MHHLIENVMDV